MTSVIYSTILIAMGFSMGAIISWSFFKFSKTWEDKKGFLFFLGSAIVTAGCFYWLYVSWQFQVSTGINLPILIQLQIAPLAIFQYLLIATTMTFFFLWIKKGNLQRMKSGKISLLWLISLIFGITNLAIVASVGIKFVTDFGMENPVLVILRYILTTNIAASIILVVIGSAAELSRPQPII